MSRDLLMMILIQTIGSIITAISVSLGQYVTRLFTDTYGKWLCFRGYKYYEARKKTMEGSYNYNSGCHNNVYDAIEHYTTKGFKVHGNAHLSESYNGYVIKPVSYQCWDDIVFIHTEWKSPNTGTDKASYTTINHAYTLYAKTNKQLNDFIEAARTTYKNKQIEYSNNQRYYMPHINGIYVAQPILEFTDMDNLHFPGKELLLAQLDKLSKKEISKLNLMLSGEPGCGKTSIISAIAKLTGRNIIEVNLGMFESAEELANLVFNKSIHAKYDGSTMFLDIPNESRILVFEEFDTFDISHERKRTVADTDTGNSKKKEKKKSKYSKNKPEPKISLGDLLVIFDGIRKTTGAIIILTTNHFDKLDTALKRCGRINMHVELRPCLVQDALKMIAQKFPTYKPEDYPLTDYEIDPATLEACLQQSTVETLNTTIAIELEKKRKYQFERSEYERKLAEENAKIEEENAKIAEEESKGITSEISGTSSASTNDKDLADYFAKSTDPKLGSVRSYIMRDKNGTRTVPF